MKVTALLPDPLISEVKTLARGKNITDALVIALTDWVSIQKIKSLNAALKKKPLQFVEGFSAGTIRKVNRH